MIKPWLNDVITNQFMTKLEITFTGVGEDTLADASNYDVLADTSVRRNSLQHVLNDEFIFLKKGN